MNLGRISWTQDVNWTYIRRSEDFQDVFWTSYVAQKMKFSIKDFFTFCAMLCTFMLRHVSRRIVWEMLHRGNMCLRTSVPFLHLDTNITMFVIFSLWKVSWNWIPSSQNYFVIRPGLLYHLIRRNTGRLANEVFTSNPIDSSKKELTCLKIISWSNDTCHYDFPYFSNIGYFSIWELFEHNLDWAKLRLII